jgi:C-terminal processing protease CtpA/Prc
MKRILYVSFNILSFIFLFNIQLSAQESRVTFSYTDNIVKNIAKLIRENYILEEKRDVIARELEEKFDNNSYGSINDLSDLAGKLTKDLQDISDDRHFAVVYDPKRVAEMKIERDELRNEEEEKSEKNRMEIQRTRNFGFKKVEILDGNVGYLDLRNFRSITYAAETAHGAMAFLYNSDAIIIDLRKNSGGGAGMYKLLASYFFDDDSVHLGSVYNGLTDVTQEFWTLPTLPGKRMPEKDLYILTSQSTFSAAEEFAYDLKHLKRAIVVGEATGGGAHMVTKLIVNEEFYIFMPFAGAINPITNSNWEGVGVQPHHIIKSDEALETAHVLSLKKMIKISDNDEYKLKLETILNQIEH